MPKIMSLGNCTCLDWFEHAQDISDRIVSSTATGMNIYEGPMFDFCPYCGRKLVLAGVRVASADFWRGKPIDEYNHDELIGIVNGMGKEMIRLRKDFVMRIDRIRTGTL